MLKNLFIAITLLTLCATPVLAARTMEKVYKISVTLPASAEMPDRKTNAKIPPALKTGRAETTERMIIAGHNQKILLRTTVVK